MPTSIKSNWKIALILAPLLMLLLTGIAAAGPDLPPPREMPDLKEAPDKPVRSIPLRQKFPDHPQGPPSDKRAPGGGGCDKDVDLTGTIKGVVVVDAQDNGICSNADIDTYVNTVDGDVYVVQGGGQEAAMTISHIDANGNATRIIQIAWRQKNTYTPDAKAFVQGGRNYVVLSLERTAQGNAACGVVFLDVTDTRGPNPPLPPIIHQAIGADWCDVHNAFVENIFGEGRYVYLTADAPNDVRVLDIANIASTTPTEIGRYTSPTANNSNYVHDVTVLDHGGLVGRRVYLSYWDSGLVLLDAADITPGTNPTPLIGPNVIDPPGFLNHHAFGSQDGSLVIFQDEIDGSSGFETVQMWDISNTSKPVHVDSLVLGDDVPLFASHNLEINYDIDPNRVYIGWYKLGLEAWDFTSSGFTRDTPSNGRNSVLYHQAQTETDDGAYDGAWAVRLAQIGANLFIFQSDRNFGLIVNCVGCTPTVGTVTGTVTNSTGQLIQGASVSADTGQNDTTDSSGNYTLTDIPTGSRTVTASATGYVTQQKPANVTDGGTTIVDFVLDPEPTGGGTGTIKGTVRDDTGSKLGSVLVSTDSGQSDATNKGGKYSISSVLEGERTVTATIAGFDCGSSQTVTVIAGQTTTQDFDCTPN